MRPKVLPAIGVFMALAPPYAQDGLATAPARLVLVDFKTQARTPKLSASFYRDVVSKNAIGPEAAV